MGLDQNVFQAGINELGVAFEHIKFALNKNQCKTWYKYMSHLTEEQYKKRIENCIRTCKKIPTIADILDYEDIVQPAKVEAPEWFREVNRIGKRE